MPPRQRHGWWSWEFDFGLPHLRKRMVDRRISEVELRAVLESVEDVQENHEPGRWVIRGRNGNALWEVVVEPIYDEQVVLVVTAYRVSP